MTLQLELLPLARQDLAGIWDFSAGRWSTSQADRYLAEIRQALGTLCEMPQIARERTELQPPVRLYPVRSHLIAFLLQGERLIVVRVLHARADWLALLSP